MDWHHVDSRPIDQIGYDADALEAHVLFKSGRTYIYSEVSSATWDDFFNAPSKGTFLNDELKAKGYPCREV